ncbi:MAG: hypothetical protein WC405_00675 [Syntrophales bacterium]
MNIKSLDLLYVNNFIYNYVLKEKIIKVADNVSDEELLKKIVKLTSFASRNHPGYFSDGRLENIIFEIGQRIQITGDDTGDIMLEVKSFISCQKKNINLIIATEIYDTGGHTRVIDSFFKRDMDHAYILVLTNQSQEIPQWFIKGDDGYHRKIIQLNRNEGFIEKAATIRNIASYFDRVFLFTHPDDVIPVLAFSVANLPPILIDNHAHFWFWLGSSIGDIIFSHIDYMDKIAVERRFAKLSFHLPIPINNPTNIDFKKEGIDKREAKQKIGVPADSYCLLSMGSEDKFYPTDTYNFFLTINRIAENFSDVYIVIVGINKLENYYRQFISPQTKGRIIFVKPVTDPMPYYRAADIFLESFPLSSLGSLVESVVYGNACPLFAYGKDRGILNSNNIFDPRLIKKAQSENDYLQQLCQLIKNPPSRFQIVKEIQDSIIKIENNFENNLRIMISCINNVRHVPGKLPAGAFNPTVDDREVANLSLFRSLDDMFFFFLDKTICIYPCEQIKIISQLKEKMIDVSYVSAYNVLKKKLSAFISD